MVLGISQLNGEEQKKDSNLVFHYRFVKWKDKYNTKGKYLNFIAEVKKKASQKEGILIFIRYLKD